MQRCNNPRSQSYEHYGGRGINCGWSSDTAGRREFLRYLVTLDGWDRPELEIDRLDNDAGYVEGNLRFATRSENTGNKRKIADLEARVRHLERRLEESLHDPD